MAIPMGTICGSTTEAKWAPIPRLDSGSPKKAVSATTRMSQASASSQPPAIAGPLTIASEGLRESISTTVTAAALVESTGLAQIDAGAECGAGAGEGDDRDIGVDVGRDDGGAQLRLQ